MITVKQQPKSVSVVIPAYNEERNIRRVIKAAKDAEEVDEVLVVDDGSEDMTAMVAEKLGARIQSHPDNRGKGYAMETGCRESTGDILVFLDADLRNIAPRKIQRIIDPFKQGYEFVKTRFDRSGGRVTHLTAKPLLGHFFPEIDQEFSQPLSGQIGIEKSLMQRLELEKDMGVDIGLLIDAVQLGARTTEVYFGKLSHDQKDLDALDTMANAVSRTVLDRASKYNRIKKVRQMQRTAKPKETVEI